MALLKFATPLALIPLVLLPLIIFYLLPRDANPRSAEKALRELGLVMLFAAAVYLGLTFPSFSDLFPPLSPQQQALAQRIRRESRYADVLCAYHFEIAENPPQMLALAHKRVYRISSPADAQAISREINAPHRMVILDSP